MAKKFKLKYLLISFIIIAVITVSTAFSVSYAAWVAPTSDKLTTSVGLGTSKVSVEDGVTFYLDGQSYSISVSDNDFFNNLVYDNSTANGYQITIKALKGQEMYFFWNKEVVKVGEGGKFIRFAPPNGDDKLNPDPKCGVEYNSANGCFKFVGEGSEGVYYHIWFQVNGNDNHVDIANEPNQRYIDLTGATPVIHTQTDRAVTYIWDSKTQQFVLQQ